MRCGGATASPPPAPLARPPPRRPATRRPSAPAAPPCPEAAAALGALGTPPADASSVPGAPSCPMFPADSWWHSDISALPVHPQSAAFVASMGVNGHVHPDFGAGMWNGGPIGIPYVVVGGD